MTADALSEMEDLIPRLRAHARVITKDRHEADDLVQTCLERAIQRLDQFQPGTNMKAWLFTILRNCHINELRRRSRWVDSLDAADCEDLFPTNGRQEISLELRDFLRAFTRLSEPDRTVLALVGAEGLSYQEAAEIMDVPIGTVRSRLSRARARLRDLVDEGMSVSQAGQPDNRAFRH